MYESWAVSFSFFYLWKAVFFTFELKNLTRKQKKTFLLFSCGLRVIAKLCAVFKFIFAQKKLFNQHKLP